MKREMIVGIFFFVGLFALVWLTTQVKPGGFWGQEENTYHAVFTDVGGLRVKDSVYLAGLRVGQIRNISIRESDLDVEFSVEARYTLKEDSKAVIKTSSLLGGRMLSLTLGTPKADALEPGSTLESELAAGIDSILENLDGTLVSLTGTLDEAKPALVGSLENIQEVTRMIKDGEGMLGRLVADRKAGEDLANMISDAREVIGKVNDGEGALGRIISDPVMGEDIAAAASGLRMTVANFQSLSESLTSGDGLVATLVNDEEIAQKFRTSMADINSITASLREVSDKVNNGEGTVGKLLNDDSIYESLRGATDGIGGLVRKLSEGEGTIAQLINDPALYDEVRRLVINTNEAIEDAREAAPATTFSSAVISAIAGLQ